MNLELICQMVVMSVIGVNFFSLADSVISGKKKPEKPENPAEKQRFFDLLGAVLGTVLLFAVLYGAGAFDQFALVLVQ